MGACEIVLLPGEEAGTYNAVKCSDPGHHFIVASGPMASEAYYASAFRRHAAQYEEGRAPDIAVDWEVSASCSVCGDGGDVRQEDSESVGCRDCGTSWYIDGTYGTREGHQ